MNINYYFILQFIDIHINELMTYINSLIEKYQTTKYTHYKTKLQFYLFNKKFQQHTRQPCVPDCRANYSKPGPIIILFAQHVLKCQQEAKHIYNKMTDKKKETVVSLLEYSREVITQLVLMQFLVEPIVNPSFINGYNMWRKEARKR